MMIKVRRLPSLCLGLLLMLASLDSEATIKAFLNQTTVYDGDAVLLTLESDRKLTDNPDLSVLDKDFIVQGTSQGSNFSMVNGNTSFTQTWTIHLMPKTRGELIIPPIQVGSEFTKPIKLTVAEVTPEVQAKNKEHVTLEAKVDIGGKPPYVQQQIRYTLKLYTDEMVREGDMYPPELENAVIEQISGDKQYVINRNGKRLSVLERHYVISPEKSGKLIIPPAIFKGKQQTGREQQQRSGVFDDFFNDPFFNSPFGSSGKPITTRSDPIEVTVQTIPAAFKGDHWLPAEDLVVIDSWEKQLPTFRVGEPVERTLTLQAKGLAGSQVPEFVVPKPETMRVYPEQEKTLTKTDGETVFGIRTQAMSYIPNKQGKVVIPAIKIDWWNTETNQQESFILKKRVINVLAGAVSEQNAVSGEEPEADFVSESKKRDKDANALGDTPNNTTPNNTLNDYVLWIFVVLILISALGYIAYWLMDRFGLFRQKASNKKVEGLPKTSVRQLMNTLQLACEKNDKKLAESTLLSLADSLWDTDPPTNLGVLARRVEKGGKEIQRLDESLYAGADQAWKGDSLWRALNDGLKPKVKREQENQGVLAGGLYPERL